MTPTTRENKVKAWNSLYLDPHKTIHVDNLCGHKDGDTIHFMLNNNGVRTGPYTAKVKLFLPKKETK